MLYPNPGGPRQPLDRQLRYYSEALRLASATLVGAALGNASEHAFPTSATRNKSATGMGRTAPCTINGKGLNAQNAAPIGVAFWGPALPLASQNTVAGGFFHRTYCRHPRPVHPFLRAASLAVALAGRLLFFGCPILRGSRYITGTYQVAIVGPFETSFVFNYLLEIFDSNCLDSGSRRGE